MSDGIVTKVTNKGLGLIQDDSGREVFFHSADLEGTVFENLTPGDAESYDMSEGPNGFSFRTQRNVNFSACRLVPSGSSSVFIGSRLRVKVL